jgi:hypothetical protein
MKTLQKITTWFVAAVMSLALLALVPARAETKTEAQPSTEHKFELAKKYYAECKNVEAADFEAIRPYLKAFTDAEVMADMMSDPIKFSKLMQVVNDPRTMHVMMKCSTEPVMWDTWMRGLTDPTKLMNAAMRFMNPMVYFNWAMAPMNPQMYAPMFAMMNPQYYLNWMNAGMNPAFYQPMFAFMDPNWYTPRLQWMMNPNSFQPFYNLFGAAVPQVSPATGEQPVEQLK